MKGNKIKSFMQLAGQPTAERLHTSNETQRKLAAQLLLSETLEYVIHGLGVTPEFNGTKITAPNDVEYSLSETAPDPKEMVDGLADVAYTMYWNALALGIPLEEAFELVCDNNLEKFVRLDKQQFKAGKLEAEQWHCDKNSTWPKEVRSVEALQIQGEMFAVGKDASGKVRKPSSYESVDLSGLL